MAVQLIMDHTGHSTEVFDKADKVSVEEAEKRFAELTSKGFRAAVKTGDGDREIVDSFSPEHEDTLFIPALKGG